MDLERLVSSNYPLIAVETIEEKRLEELAEQIAWRINRPLYLWDCNEGLRKANNSQSFYKTQNPLVALETVYGLGNGLYIFKDLKYYLDDHVLQRKLKTICQEFSNKKTILFVSSSDDYPEEVSEILVNYSLPLPTKEQLEKLLSQFINSTQVEISLSADEKNRLIENLRGLTNFEAKRVIAEAVSDKILDNEDVRKIAAIKKKQVEKNQLVEYISCEDNFKVVGGLKNLKEWIAKRKIAFTDNAFNLPAPKGVLLIGVPGCGKTLCARAIANMLDVGLIKLDPSKLYNKFVGESEANLQKVLKLAESLAPIVLLIDEVEKVLPNTNANSTDGGLSSRLFGTFLSWLQDKEDSIFVVATSNDITALPPEFSRKGRFDEIFFVDLPEQNERRTIFDIHLKRRNIDPAKIAVDELVQLTEGFSGAEIEELILSSLYSITLGPGNISTEIIKEEISKTIPLSRRDAERIKALREWASTHTIKA